MVNTIWFQFDLIRFLCVLEWAQRSILTLFFNHIFSRSLTRPSNENDKKMVMIMSDHFFLSSYFIWFLGNFEILYKIIWEKYFSWGFFLSEIGYKIKFTRPSNFEWICFVKIIFTKQFIFFVEEYQMIFITPKMNPTVVFSLNKILFF